MSITYNIRVTGLRVRNEGDLANVVRVVDFTITGVDGDVRYDIASSHEFRGEVGSEGFTPMENLTEAEVLGWLTADPNILAGIRGNIEYFINQKKAEMSLVSKPAPWLPPVPMPPNPMPLMPIGPGSGPSPASAE